MSVEEPDVIDLVAHEPEGEVVLIMVESRPWDGRNERLIQLQEKIDTYVAYALEGLLVAQYPEFAGKRVRLELRCVEDPDQTTAGFLEMAGKNLAALGLGLAVKKSGARPAE